MAGLWVSAFVSLSLCTLALADLDTTPRSTLVTSTAKIIEPIAEAYRICRQASAIREEAEVMCAALPEIKECLLQEEGKWNKTNSEVRRVVFVMYRQLWETTMDRLCDSHAENLSKILNAYEEFKAIPRRDKLFVMTECFFYAPMSMTIADDSQADIASKVWYFYHQVQNYRECFDKYSHMEGDFIKLLKELATETFKIMKCLRPQSGAIVPCKEVDTTLIDRASMCPVQVEYTLPDVSASIVKKSIECFKLPDLSMAESLEQFQNRFRGYCGDAADERVLHCHTAQHIAADLCLPERYFQKFQLIRFYLELARRTACEQHGDGLATLFYRYRVVNNSTGEGGTDCLQGTLVGESGSLDVNGYYNELPTIRKCLLDNVHEDAAFQTTLDGMFDTVRDGMKCLDPEGKVVFCKDIF